MLTWYPVIFPSFTSRRCSFTHAEVMPRSVLWARAMPAWMASSKLLLERALISDGDQPPRMLRLADRTQLWKAEEGMSLSASFSPDGRWVVLASEGGVDIRDARTGKVRRSWKRDETLGLPSPSLAWSEGGRMVAMVDAGDVATVESVMTTDVETVQEDTPVAALVELMAVRGYRHIPVLDDAEHLVGLVSRAELITVLNRLLLGGGTPTPG